jgi:nucleoside 2-deoxyribosyltransferase
MQGRCCIFQPFDKGPFDKRCADVLEPAIKAADLEPYRVDKDDRASIPIDALHEQIKAALICLADITTDNPNVWYELGYAFASDKPVVLICSSQRETKYPFDIQHRKIISYSPESTSDFEKLKSDITKRIVAELKKQAEVQDIVSASPVRAAEGLRAHEISALALIMAIRGGLDLGATEYQLKDEMRKAGFNQMATSLAVTALRRNGYIESVEEQEWNGDRFQALRLTEKGENWLVDNQDKLELRTVQPKSGDEDLPF